MQDEPDSSAAAEILVLRRGALGDTLCLLPVLEAVRHCWPESRVTLAGRAEVAALLAERGVVDRGVSSESLGLWRLDADPEAREACVQGLLVYDRIVGELDAVGLPAALAARVCGFDVVVDEDGNRSAAEQLLARAARVWPVAWPAPLPVPRLPRRAPPPNDRRLWLHPGSGSPRKNWPGFVALAERALASGWHVTVSFGEADDEARVLRWPAGVELVDSPALTVLAGELEGAAAYAGNDSGVTHLAAALGLATVVFFGPSSPTVWAPRAERVHVVRFRPATEPAARAAELEDALAAIADFIRA